MQPPKAALLKEASKIKCTAFSSTQKASALVTAAWLKDNISHLLKASVAFSHAKPQPPKALPSLSLSHPQLKHQSAARLSEKEGFSKLWLPTPRFRVISAQIG